MPKKVLLCIIFVTCLMINICGWDDEIIAYIVSIVLVAVVDFVWKRFK